MYKAVRKRSRMDHKTSQEIEKFFFAQCFQDILELILYCHLQFKICSGSARRLERIKLL